MKPLVLFHAHCADGFGAAFAAWLKFGDEAEYVAMQYLDSKLTPVEAWEAFSTAIPSKANTGREIYILDFSLPKPVMNKLLAVSERVVWRDHHKSAFEMWCGKYEKGMQYDQIGDSASGEIDIFLDDNKSGAVLAWEYFHPGTEVPMFIRHIDDYDRWQFKIEGTKAFNKGLWSHTPWSFALWKHILTNKVAFKKVIDEGEAILRAHDQNVQSVVKGSARNCTMYDLGDEWIGHGLAANCPPHLTSDVGHELATQSGTFGLCWTLGQTGTVAKCSLRSNGDYDVSAIAKSFGGGGHRNAAGFEVDIQTLLEWLK